MKRTQLYIEEDLDQRLRVTATAEGRSAAALTREALRTYLDSKEKGPKGSDPFLDLAGQFAGGASDSSINHDKYLYGGAE